MTQKKEQLSFASSTPSSETAVDKMSTNDSQPQKTAVANWSNGVPSLNLRWKAWSRPSARTLAKTISSMMEAMTTTTWLSYDLRWQVTHADKLVELSLWATPSDR